MALGLFTVLFSFASAQDYVSITDPAQLTYMPENNVNTTHVLYANETRFTRFTTSNQFSVTAWVLIEASGGIPKQILNLRGYSYWYAWLEEDSGNETPVINLYAGEDGAMTSTSVTIPLGYWTLEWLHVTMSIKDDTKKLTIGKFTAGIVSSTNGVGTSLRSWDSEGTQFQIGAETASDSFQGWILDVRFYNQYLDSDYIGTLLSSTTCHSTCSNCWGPSEWSCLDKIQTSPIFEETTVSSSSNLKYHYNDPIFERTRDDWTADTSWAGFVKDSQSNLQGANEPIFLTVNDYSTYSSQDYIGVVNGFDLQNFLGYTAGFMYYGQGYQTSLNQTNYLGYVMQPSDQYRWIGLSFCSDKLILCFVNLDDTNPEPACYSQAITAGQEPAIWQGLGADNEMYLGTKDNANQVNKFKDVRYFMKGCISEAELTAIYSEQSQLWISGCLTCTDFQTWGTCATGRYLDTENGACPLCHYTCAACSSGFDTDCSACSTGYYSQSGLAICSASCAFGFNANDSNKTCEGTPGLVYEQNLNFASQVYKNNSSIQLQSGQTSQVEDSDPLVTTNRGFEFDGVDDIVMISGSPMLTIHANFTVIMWLFIASDGTSSSCALSKQTTTNAAFFQMCFVPLSSTTSSAEATVLLSSELGLKNAQQPVTHGIWFIWAITGKFEINTDLSSTSTTQSYINNSHLSTITDTTGLWDSESNDFKLGAGIVSGIGLNYFKGNISSLSIYNASQTVAEIGSHAQVGANCPQSCQSACFPTAQCVDACTAPMYTVEDDAQACLTEWPFLGYYTNAGELTCQPCQTSNCSICGTSVSTCTKWLTGFLGPKGTCDDSCPSNYASNADNVCESCHETWTSCSTTSSSDCITCLDGWRRRTDTTESSDCLCDMPILDNTTSSLQVACMNAPFTQVPMQQSQQIDYIGAIASKPDLNTADLAVVFGVSDGIQFEDTSQTSELNEVLNQAWILALENSGAASFSYTGTDVEAHAQRGNVDSFVNAELLTESGSGVVLPSLDDVLEPGVPMQVNVFSYNTSQTLETNETLVGQVLSIEAFSLNNTEGSQLSLTNLTSNLTIVFEGLNLNTTQTYECVYLLPNYTWSLDGCYLSSVLNDIAQCSCNHLSQFSMRKFNSSASVSTNIDATVDVENIENFDINTSTAPIACLGVIYGVYFTLLVLLCRLDWNSEKMKNRIFVRSRTMRLQIHAELIKQQTVGPQKVQNASQEQDGSLMVQDLENESLSPKSDSIDQKAGTPDQPEMDDIQAVPLDSLPVETLATHRPDVQSQSIVLDTEGQLVSEPQNQEVKPKPKCGKFRSMFLDDSLVVGMLCDKHGAVSRADKLTIMLVLLMLELFAIGLFYDSDRNPDEEEKQDDKTVSETLENFGWRDFWITIYTMCIVIPVPFILTILFKRKELHPDEENIDKKKKKMRINRFAGYSICFVVCVWCTWSIVAFSTEFGQNTSQSWLVNFGITTLGEIICKDQIITVITAFLALYLPECKEKCKKKKNVRRVDPDVNTQNSPKVENHLILTE